MEKNAILIEKASIQNNIGQNGDISVTSPPIFGVLTYWYSSIFSGWIKENVMHGIYSSCPTLLMQPDRRDKPLIN